LILAGIIQDQAYYDQFVAPRIDNDKVVYIAAPDPLSATGCSARPARFYTLIQFNEPFGLSVIESMACGTPVIASAKAPCPSLSKRQEWFLVNNADEAIEAVARIEDIDRADCRRHVERHFTIDRMVG